MSACFLYVSHPQGFKAFEDLSVSNALGKWLPFKPEKQGIWYHPSQRISAITWETHLEGARGGHHASSSANRLGLSFSGWWREPDSAPLELNSAQTMLSALCGVDQSALQLRSGSNLSYEKGLARFSPSEAWSSPHSNLNSNLNIRALEALHLSPGQFTVALGDQDGHLHGINGAFGGLPLYYASANKSLLGENIPVTLISNRASLISAYLGCGKVASPRLESLAWLLARHEQALGDAESAWSGIYRLHSGERVEAFDGLAEIKSVPLPHIQSYDWETLFEGLLWRVNYLKRLPDVPISMAITGGFDSRLVLGALIATKQLDRVQRYFINADPSHVDTLAAQGIAQAYGLHLEIEKPGIWRDHDEAIVPRLKRHNFLVEYLCNAWDIQSGPKSFKLPFDASLSGHFGELYRSHFHKYLSHSNLLSTLIYPSHRYNDRHQLLTREMLDYTGEKAKSWIKSQLKKGVKVDALFDQIHRYSRMEGWATQNQPVAQIAYPSFSFLSCVSTRAHYEAQSRADQKLNTVHFNLMKQVDDQLWRLPFAKSTWPSSFYEQYAAPITPPITGAYHQVGAQLRLWSEQGKSLCERLLDTDHSSSFWQLIDRRKLEKKIKTTQSEPSAKYVKALFCTSAIQIAVTEAFEATAFER